MRMIGHRRRACDSWSDLAAHTQTPTDRAYTRRIGLQEHKLEAGLSWS
jgi:hypothetical protein